MKKLLFFAFMIIFYWGQSQITGCVDSSACNYNELATQSSIVFDTPIITGSNMTIGFTENTQTNLIIGDQIGVFGQVLGGGNYTYGLILFDGENAALTVYGDDPTTPEADGMNVEDFITFLVKRQIDPGVYAVFQTEVNLSIVSDLQNGPPGLYQYLSNGIYFATSFNITNIIYGCEYANTGEDCDGNCLEGFVDLDGICIEGEGGCTDLLACNYNEIALVDDGSCIYPDLCNDCNGEPIDTDQDGISDCNEIVGCSDAIACNYNSEATDDGPCVYTVQYYDCNGICINDADSDGVCDQLEIMGCQDDIACNYNEIATDAGACIYAEDYYDCDGACLNDTDGDEVCDELEILGCTDPIAIGYDPVATENDGSCIYCGSIDFMNNNNALEVNDLHFQEANGVTISFWAYDDNWSLSDENEDTFGYFVDFGSENTYRYVIRWRDGVKGIQAYYEGAGFQSYQGVDCDGMFPENCYTYGQTNATYVIPPFDYVGNSDIYNWWEENECGWKNITAVFCSNGVRLYIDGQIVQQSITGVYYPEPIFSLSAQDAKVIGSDQSGFSPCDVKIDEFRIWSRALSDSEIQERLGDNIDINLNMLAEENNSVGKLEGYWKFDSLSVRNQVTNEFAIESIASVFSTQYCDYSCDNYDYSVLCSDNSNNDCDACTPSEGCMDENADNYDELADIDNGLCFYYGCMDNGLNIWSYIPGLAACNYDPTANVNFLSPNDFVNPCEYPVSGYDCDGVCLYDCDNDGVCDWTPNHCYDMEGNQILTDVIDNLTLEEGSDGLLDCWSFINIDPIDNCLPLYEIYLLSQDIINNITFDSIPDGVPDCLEDFDYQEYYNPLQTDVDGDGIGNACDDSDSTTQLGCMDDAACNYDFWADTPCEDCCVFCYLDDCENYPTTYFVSEDGSYVNGPYDCVGSCADLNLDGVSDDIDDDDICDMVDNCPNFWNPGQIDTDGDGLGDACEESSLISYGGLHYTIYPNPFSDYTVINFNNLQSSVKLEIFKLSGQLVYKNVTKEDAIIIYKSNLSRGLYILEITQNTLLTRDVLVIN